jgi:predicted GH43/DUF377 family glycosyl hydrolase
VIAGQLGSRLAIAALGLVLTACQAGEAISTTTTSPPATTSAPRISTSTSFPATTTTTVDMGPLNLLAEEPVVTPSGANRYVNPGWTEHLGDVWLMFRNSFSAWPGPSDVSLMVSNDGLNWEEHGDGVVFTSDQVPWTDGNVFFMSGYLNEDDSAVAYFYTYDGTLESGSIGRATAPTLDGPWDPDPEPVLMPGESDDWDGRRVIEPSVIVEDGRWVMWYTGVSAGGVSQVGMAMSADGITWDKYDDPATNGPARDSSDPVFAGDPSWAPEGIDNPSVTPLEDGYLMLYRSPGGLFRAGLAESGDGVAWNPIGSEPMITQARTPGNNQFWQYDLVEVGGDDWIFLEVGPGSLNTDIYAYTIDPNS